MNLHANAALSLKTVRAYRPRRLRSGARRRSRLDPDPYDGHVRRAGISPRRIGTPDLRTTEPGRLSSGMTPNQP